MVPPNIRAAPSVLVLGSRASEQAGRPPTRARTCLPPQRDNDTTRGGASLAAAAMAMRNILDTDSQVRRESSRGSVGGLGECRKLAERELWLGLIALLTRLPIMLLSIWQSRSRCAC